MRTILLTSLLIFAIGGPALAEDEPLLGEVHVDMNTDYCKVEIDEDEYSAVEYEKNGRRALIKNLSLDDMPKTMLLRPVDASLEPVELTVDKKDFKRKRVAKAWVMVVSRKVTFKKRQTDKPAEPAKPAEPEKKPQKAPTPEPDDL